MTQLVTRVPEALASAIDDLVSKGLYENRSEMVRTAIEELVDRTKRAADGAKIVEGYTKHPQNADETGWSDKAAIAMILEEPWD